ncbi:hypothetical protein QNH07_gp18 [Aeromonas phage BUCT696]|uniref:hypothetical protein n=1 Tax=Aeromonas phage BUCT696 TaxID=2911664 RepID=UPI0024AE0EE0|nr:hypothetical protein QNH07_gp18 [Aeromonas phage BUCT696]UKH48783.1 hypothetical protein [Aeromonas phage BUCT696]
MSYLATHPRRGFRPGDEVIHVGEGVSYRGRLGRVVSVHGSKANGHIKVMWDHKMTAMEYSIHWSLCSLGVHINCLRQQYHDFDGRKYAAKYMHYGFCGGDVCKGFAMTPHRTMKAQTDAKLSIEKSLNESDFDIMRQLQSSLLSCMPANLGPGLYTLVPHENGLGWRVIAKAPEPKPAQPAKPEVCEPRKDMTYPAIIENRADGTITHVSSEAMLQSLGEGTYTVYSKVGNISVKPVAQKEITFM